MVVDCMFCIYLYCRSFFLYVILMCSIYYFNVLNEIIEYLIQVNCKIVLK